MGKKINLGNVMGPQGPQGLTVNEYNSNKWISGNEGYDSILVGTFTQNFSITTYQNRCSFLLVVTVEIQNLDNLNETILTGTNIFLINAPIKVASNSYSNSPTSPEMKLKASIVAMTFDMDIGFIEGSYGLGAKIYIKESSQTQRKRYSFSIIPFDKESRKIENNRYSTSFNTTTTNRYDEYIKHYSANVIV